MSRLHGLNYDFQGANYVGACKFFSLLPSPIMLPKRLKFLSLCLALSCAAPVLADNPGGSTATAIALAVNGRATGAIQPAGDNDYFRVDVLGNGLLTVYTQGSTDTYGYLLDANGATLAANDDSSDRNFRLSYVVTTGTYYVRVRHYNVRATGNYTLVSTCSGCTLPVPPDDHGGTTAAATPMPANGSRTGNIERQGDEDYFKFSLPGSGTLTVKTTGTTDTYGHLLNAAGTQLAVSDDDVDRNFRISLPVAGGTYYLRVHHYNPRAMGAYTLVSQFSAGKPFAAATDGFAAAKAGMCLDIDGLNGCQGMDVLWAFTQDVLGIPFAAHDIRGNPAAVFAALPPSKTISSGSRRIRLDKMAYTAGAVPQKGDIVFWAAAADNGNTGHVAVALSGTSAKFTSLDQNRPAYNATSGSSAARATHGYAGVTGWLRPVLVAD